METENGVAVRLIQVRESFGDTQKGFAAKIGIGVSTWQRIERGENIPSGETLLRIAALGIDPGWILTGNGNMAAPNVPQQSNVVAIPILSVRASAGPGATADEEKATGFIDIDRALMTQLGLRPTETSALKIQGDSAFPTLSDGDLVLVDRSHTHPQDGLLYVIGVDNDVVVKRIQRMVDGGLLLKSDNASYEAQRVSAADAPALRIIGRVKYALHAV